MSRVIITSASGEIYFDKDYEIVFSGAPEYQFLKLNHMMRLDESIPFKVNNEIVKELAYNKIVLYIDADEYAAWAEDYQPWLQAGWTNSIGSWYYNTKGIVPKLKPYLESTDIKDDMEFIEVINPKDWNLVVLKKLDALVNETEEDLYVVIIKER